jgi:peptide/nickel transport system permease protein
MSLGPVTSSADEVAPSLAEETSTPPGVAPKAIEGRSLGRIAWIRLKRDRVAMGGGIVIVLLVLVALLAPLLSDWFGSPPNDFHSDLIDPNLGVPTGKYGGISSTHILGVEPINGRDVFSRIVYGAQVSLLVAVAAALVATVLGTVLGMTAGFLGGWVDTLISRLMDLLLAFPQLLFTIALISVVPDKILGIGGTGARLLVLVVVIGFFGWPYIGRIVRGQTLTLREREFVEASRSLGARSGYIIFRELLPNLVAPILVYATLIIPTNILTEAALSYLGVGVRPPSASWGAMLSNATDFYQADPTYMIVPGVAIFITVLAFNLFGDGLRDALDPRSNR